MKEGNSTGYLNALLFNFSLKTRKYETLTDYSHIHQVFYLSDDCNA